MKTNRSAVIVLSGGQDSLTCLGLALAQGLKVEAISFDYNQRHAVELAGAAMVCQLHGVPHNIVEVPALSKLVTSALTGDGDVSVPHAYKAGLPASFVPSRNALFLTLAHGLAQEREFDAVITGVCQTDFSGYPDCRDTFVKLLALALNEGYQSNITIETPLMFLDKADTFAVAERIGWLHTIIHQSHTCYNGDHLTKHEWGFGCGKCPACSVRANGWQRFCEGNFNPALVDQAVAG